MWRDRGTRVGKDAGRGQHMLDVIYKRLIDGHTFVLRGDVDLNTWPILGQHLGHLIADGEGDVWLDVHGVGFLDSRGLAELVNAQRALNERGRNLFLVRTSETVHAAFSAVGLEELFTFV